MGIERAVTHKALSNAHPIGGDSGDNHVQLLRYIELFVPARDLLGPTLGEPCCFAILNAFP